MQRPLSILCISFFFKGAEFISECKAQGNTVYLLTKEKLRNDPWPKDDIDEMFFLPKGDNSPENMREIINGLAYVLKSRPVDTIVALDDYDIEKAALVREHFRISGMGQSTARHFRDKLAMRIRAQEAGIKVPPFSALFNDQAITDYLKAHEGPWVIKPRSEAAAAGIKKVYSLEEAWEVLHKIGEERHHFLIEQFRPGDVYHADALMYNNEMQFCSVSKYLNTPFEVAHGGGIFRSAIVPYGSDDEKRLKALNEQVLKIFGLKRGASHSEFIKSKEDGSFYFLETSARVGGAHLSEMVKFASGINLWREWAKIENVSLRGFSYELPEVQEEYAGIVISLSRYEHPDQRFFDAPEIVWRLQKKNHVGMVLQSDNEERVHKLLDEYALTIKDKLHASAPARDSAIDGDD